MVARGEERKKEKGSDREREIFEGRKELVTAVVRKKGWACRKVGATDFRSCSVRQAGERGATPRLPNA